MNWSWSTWVNTLHSHYGGIAGDEVCNLEDLGAVLESVYILSSGKFISVGPWDSRDTNIPGIHSIYPETHLLPEKIWKSEKKSEIAEKKEQKRFWTVRWEACGFVKSKQPTPRDLVKCILKIYIPLLMSQSANALVQNFDEKPCWNWLY